MSEFNHVYLLSRNGSKNSIYTSWIDALKLPYTFVEEYDRNWRCPEDAGLLVTHHHYRLLETQIIQRVMEEGKVPVLILADGILEHRNTFENPNNAPGAIFQPLLGHKLASIGRSQVRFVEQWNEPGCCELVGLPRLDPLLRSRQVEPQQPNSNEANSSEANSIHKTETSATRPAGLTKRVLVATARHPAFTEPQYEKVLEGLQHLKNWFDANRWLNGARIVPLWRVSDELCQQLQIPEERQSKRKLHQELRGATAVITTPSTLALESYLSDLPTALIDFTWSPSYLPAAWTIQSPTQIDSIAKELLQPPASKMLYQNTVLRDALECQSPARPRMVTLIRRMVAIANTRRQKNAPIQFPARILDLDESSSIDWKSFDFRELYRENPLVDYSSRLNLPSGESVGLEQVLQHAMLEINKLEKQLEEIREERRDWQIEVNKNQRAIFRTFQSVHWYKSHFERLSRVHRERPRWSSNRVSNYYANCMMNNGLGFDHCLSLNRNQRRVLQPHFSEALNESKIVLPPKPQKYRYSEPKLDPKGILRQQKRVTSKSNEKLNGRRLRLRRFLPYESPVFKRQVKKMRIPKPTF